MKNTWRRGSTVAGILLCAAATAADLQAQAPWLESGPSVRWTVPCHPRTVEEEGFPTTTCQVPASLQEAEGSRSHPRLGAAVGFVLGAGATYLVLNSGGSTALCDESANQDAMGSGACLGAYVLGGVIGAGVGAGVGALIRTSRWESVPRARLGVAVLPERRLGFEARLKW